MLNLKNKDMLDFSFFKFWSKKELDDQTARTEKKINALNTMLSENPDNIFLKSQLNQEYNKLNYIKDAQNSQL